VRKNRTTQKDCVTVYNICTVINQKGDDDVL